MFPRLIDWYIHSLNGLRAAKASNYGVLDDLWDRVIEEEGGRLQAINSYLNRGGE